MMSPPEVCCMEPENYKKIFRALYWSGVRRIEKKNQRNKLLKREKSKSLTHTNFSLCNAPELLGNASQFAVFSAVRQSVLSRWRNLYCPESDCSDDSDNEVTHTQISHVKVPKAATSGRLGSGREAPSSSLERAEFHKLIKCEQISKMFRMESFITPLLLSYVDKYVKDFRPADAQLSLWGGGVALNNLVLKTEVLQNELSLPFNLISGRINELLIRVPWTKIMSEPIVVTIDTIECIVSHRPIPTPAQPQPDAQDAQDPPGYVQAIIRKIVSNISLHVQHLILKYVEDDIVLSLNVNRLTVDSADANWELAFQDIPTKHPVLRRVINVADITLCLDEYDWDGAIRFFQEPLLCRSQLKIKLLTRLASATSLRAISHHIEVRSSELAFGVTNEQIQLLMRLLNKISEIEIARQHQAAANRPFVPPVLPLCLPSTSSGQGNAGKSWAQWAMSWFLCMDKDEDLEETLLSASTVVIRFMVYFNSISLTFKKIDIDGGVRRRSRAILELAIQYATARGIVRAPYAYDIGLGARNVILRASGKCVCDLPENHTQRINNIIESTNKTDYLGKYPRPDNDEPFDWPPFNIETFKLPPDLVSDVQVTDVTKTEEKISEELFWALMDSTLFMKFEHTRYPPPSLEVSPIRMNNFQYSDWRENVKITFVAKALELQLSTGFLHRVNSILKIFRELPPVAALIKRILTVEECEALHANIPFRHVNFEIYDIRIRLQPCDHSLTEAVELPAIYLDLQAPEIIITTTAPLYPYRVCSAASQIPEDEGTLWNGARMVLTAKCSTIYASLSCPNNNVFSKPIGSLDLSVDLHYLLCSEFFASRNSESLSFSLIIREMNICGSAARLLAASNIVTSLVTDKVLFSLKHSSVCQDALYDEEYVAIDVTAEGINIRAHILEKTTTQSITVDSARAMLLHKPSVSTMKQAWLFSAPEVPTTFPYLRVSAQFGNEHSSTAFDYVGMWLGSSSICFDPLFLKWLAYMPSINFVMETKPEPIPRKPTLPVTTSGRNSSKAGSNNDIHFTKPRGPFSSTEQKEEKPETPDKDLMVNDERALRLHRRLRFTLINVECENTSLYVTTSTVSALDCDTIIDALEKHAEDNNPVICFCFGHFSWHSNAVMKHLWAYVKYDGPTVFDTNRINPKSDCFPWKMLMSGVSCYTLEPDNSIRNIPAKYAVTQQFIIKNIEHAVTVSVVNRIIPPKNTNKKDNQGPSTSSDDRVKYFTAGVDFKPSTLKEFVRGPTKYRSRSQEGRNDNPSNDPQPERPKMSIEICIHIETIPITCNLLERQLYILMSAMHCFHHLISLFKAWSHTLNQQLPNTYAQFNFFGYSATLESRSPSEGSGPELIARYEAQRENQKLKPTIWCQWLTSRIVFAFISESGKLAGIFDDNIATVDCQMQYKQLKLKISSGYLKHFERGLPNEWIPGPIEGRVITALESTETNFMTITITQADLASLPASWKMDLPLCLRSKSNTDTMTELCITVTPMEVIVRPEILKQFKILVNGMTLNTACALASSQTRPDPVEYPLGSFSTGGIRLLLTTDDRTSTPYDDTVMFVAGKSYITPYPENPICRRPITVGSDTAYLTAGGAFEGRQYEFMFKDVGIHTGKLDQLVTRYQDVDNEGLDNPAVLWAQFSEPPVITPIIDSFEMGWLVAPPLFVDDRIICGPAIEINIVSDFSVELSVSQLKLMAIVATGLRKVFQEISKKDKRNNSKEPEICPYVSLTFRNSSYGSPEEQVEIQPEDSGVQSERSAGPKTIKLPGISFRQSYPFGYTDDSPVSPNNLDIFVVAGTVGLSLYTNDDSHELKSALRPQSFDDDLDDETNINESFVWFDDTLTDLDQTLRPPTTSNTMEVDYVYENANRTPISQGQGVLPLLYITMQQPNLYFWKRKDRNNLQLSVFDCEIGLGSSQMEGLWHDGMFSTERGEPDPITDIPPTLATLKIFVPNPTENSKATGSVRLDIERPVLIHVSIDKIRRLRVINELIASEFAELNDSPAPETPSEPFLYNLKNLLVAHNIENVNGYMTQLCISGSYGVIAYDKATLQIATSTRAERLICRSMITGFLVSLKGVDEIQTLIQPLVIGVELECLWETWRRIGGVSRGNFSSLQLRLDFDQIIIDLRPEDFVSLDKLCNTVLNFFREFNTTTVDSKSTTSSVASLSGDTMNPYEHHYQDDLRSGAFKILFREVHPMAYQAAVYEDTLIWRYPHPRAISKIFMTPKRSLSSDMEYSLEGYCYARKCWQHVQNVVFPEKNSTKYIIYTCPREALFSDLWRIRLFPDVTEPPEFVFEEDNYTPQTNLMLNELPREFLSSRTICSVPPEYLLPAFRVDSYFNPYLVPQFAISCRVAMFTLHLHNTSTEIRKFKKCFSNVSQMSKTHSVLALTLKNVAGYVQHESQIGTLALFESRIFASLIDSATSRFNELLSLSTVQVSLSKNPMTPAENKLYFRTRLLHFKLNIPRIRTLKCLVDDWCVGMEPMIPSISSESIEEEEATNVDYIRALDGRITIWIHNQTNLALKMGQVNTDESEILGPGRKLAYRWRSPAAMQKLRFALSIKDDPSFDPPWSEALDFLDPESNIELTATSSMGDPVLLYTNIEEKGVTKCLTLSARLHIANLIKADLEFKVQTYCSDVAEWITIYTGELTCETIGSSIFSSSRGLQMTIKFSKQETGWSGPVPLQEFGEGNISWLVKVPTIGNIPYVPLWCRITQSAIDGRVVASLWPMYSLRSYLSLDMDVTIDSNNISDPLINETTQLVQTGFGCGVTSHLLTPGTLNATHDLTFKYKNMETPVTQEKIPLSYGITNDKTVANKKTFTTNINDILVELKKCISLRQSLVTNWPYSIVKDHIDGNWMPALFQPRSDCLVKYVAVPISGGSSIELEIRPMVLFCNASPVTLTIRSFDAAPICTLDTGNVIALDANVLKGVFYLSIELGTETFVSEPLQVCPTDVGPYGTPDKGMVAIDHPIDLAICCQHKVALLKLYYELNDDINLLGLSAIHVVINNLKTSILVSPIVVPNSDEESIKLDPKSYTSIPPQTESGQSLGTAVRCFFVQGRWRGGEVSELQKFLCLALARGDKPAYPAVPIKLGEDVLRRSFTLRNSKHESVPVVVTQQRRDGRWTITIAEDTCPEYIIYNKTDKFIAVAKPQQNPNEPSSNGFSIMEECEGVRWNYNVEPNSWIYYSVPDYCAKYPPIIKSDEPLRVPFLTFAKNTEDGELQWSAAVPIVPTELMLLLPGDKTVKIRSQINPHSTLVILQHIEETDISASDIRNRIASPQKISAVMEDTSSINRTSANSQLASSSTSGPDPTDNSISSSQLSPRFLAEVPEMPAHVWNPTERLRGVFEGIIIELSEMPEENGLVVVFIDNLAVNYSAGDDFSEITLNASHVQVNNNMFLEGNFDFHVVAYTYDSRQVWDPANWEPLWVAFSNDESFKKIKDSSKLFLRAKFDIWKLFDTNFKELTEIEIDCSKLILFCEDTYMSKVVKMFRLIMGNTNLKGSNMMTDAANMQRPLRLRLLHIHDVDLILTLHTAVRMYIALDRSRIHLNTFRTRNVMTTFERLTHALTVHYLSDAILSAGWVIGGLELLGAPGAIASRISGATGGVMGVATTTAAAFVWSISAWAGSLARNLDLLAGDDEHTIRAAAIRRRPPDSFIAGLREGFSNFAINMLGAVGGIAHHPVVGVAIGESSSRVSGIRRGLVGAVTKPLSAAVDLLALAGHGLLRQTGWVPMPLPREIPESLEMVYGWARDGVRIRMKFPGLTLAGFQILFNDIPVTIMFTRECMVVINPETECIIEAIKLCDCTIEKCDGSNIQLLLKCAEVPGNDDTTDEEEEVGQMNVITKDRVSRYTGAIQERPSQRRLHINADPEQHYYLVAMLTTLIHRNTNCYFIII